MLGDVSKLTPVPADVPTVAGSVLLYARMLTPIPVALVF
jgi:hypothetical protein